jgi:arabinogalactan oligomer/maltooligosaccharide transport system permease protein
MKSLKARRIIGNTVIYVILSVMAVIWLAPIVWIFLQSFSGDGVASRMEFIPSTWTFNNYLYLFSNFSHQVDETASAHAIDGLFFTWFCNTLIIAVLSCIVSTMFVLMTAYALSRFRFKGRGIFMKANLVIGMFPGFLTMIILYWVMKEIFHLQGSYWSLLIIYTASSGMNYYIAKGFFDTISKSIDEAAMIDGANKSQIFWNIILPLAKPIVIYTILTSFMSPWGDYITSSYIIGLQNTKNWTVAIGLYQMISTNDYVVSYYTQFAAGAVCVAIPTTLLFIFLQKYYVSGVTGGAVKG